MTKHHDVSLSHQRLMEMLICQSLYYTHRSRAELWTALSHTLARHLPHERYFMTTLANMEKDGRTIISFKERHTDYFSLTEKGRAWYRAYRPVIQKRLQLVQQVAAAAMYDITGKGSPPKQIGELQGKDRTFFSTIISAMDVFRYYVLRQALQQPFIVMSDMQEGIKKHFGWNPSKSYVYQLAVKMEEEESGLIRGKWDDPLIRRRRYWKITEAGRAFYPRLAQDAGNRVTNAYYYTVEVLKALQQKGE